MIKKISAVLVIIMLFACAFAGCGGKETADAPVSNPIVGKWTGIDEGFEVIYVFNADGTGYSEVFGMKVDITDYSTTDNEITMTTDGTSTIEALFEMSIDDIIASGLATEENLELVTTETFSYSLDGDVLTIDGTEYTKVVD